MKIGFAFPMDQLQWWLLAGFSSLGIIVLLLRGLDRRRLARLSEFVELHLAPRLLLGADVRRRRPLYWFALIGMASLLLALAQPHWGESFKELQSQSHDVLVCLDISESMNAENPRPSRLERAKNKIESLLAKNPNDRFGLVVFSGESHLMCPLTLDHGYFLSVLNAVDTDSISVEGTDISNALVTAVDTLREQDEIAGQNERDFRAVLLISDGESLPTKAIEYAAELKDFSKFFVIGVGDPKGTLVSYTNPAGRRAMRMAEPETHLSRLDEGTLTRIATEGGGGYIRSTPDNTDIDEIHKLIRQIASREAASGVQIDLVNRYQWPLAVAITCFMLEGLWLVILPWLRNRESVDEDVEGARA